MRLDPQLPTTNASTKKYLRSNRLLRHRSQRPRYAPPALVLFTSLAFSVEANHTHTGNTLGAATNTLGKGVGTVTDAAGNVVTTAGKGVGDTVTGVTQGLGDTTKGK